jgi:hypothetical protein
LPGFFEEIEFDQFLRCWRGVIDNLHDGEAATVDGEAVANGEVGSDGDSAQSKTDRVRLRNDGLDLSGFFNNAGKHQTTVANSSGEDKSLFGIKGEMKFTQLAAGLVFCAFTIGVQGAEDLRIGMIGLDTSHVIAFTEILNNAKSKEHVAGGKVVAAFKGGSADIPSSANRVEGYTKQLQEKFGVKIVDSIEELCMQVDAVMIESVDGRPHLEQARPVIKAHKPLFIDKPVAGSLKDAIEIYRLAKEAGVPVFSSSSYRFYDSLVELKKMDVGELKGAISYGPAEIEPHHPDMFWYGVHPAEALFAIMGGGCESVVRTATPDTDVITGKWKGGRVGTLIGLRKGNTPHKVIVFGTKTVAEQKGEGTYANLVREIMEFYRSGKPPVSPEETIELFAFMAGADVSKKNGGCAVNIAELIAKNSK